MASSFTPSSTTSSCSTTPSCFSTLDVLRGAFSSSQPRRVPVNQLPLNSLAAVRALPPSDQLQQMLLAQLFSAGQQETSVDALLLRNSQQQLQVPVASPSSSPRPELMQVTKNRDSFSFFVCKKLLIKSPSLGGTLAPITITTLTTPPAAVGRGHRPPRRFPSATCLPVQLRPRVPRRLLSLEPLPCLLFLVPSSIIRTSYLLEQTRVTTTTLI